MTSRPKSSTLITFGSLLRHHRKLAHKEISEVAAAMGYSDSMIHMIECGQRPPRPKMVVALDEYLDAKGALIIAARQISSERLPSGFGDFESWESDCLSLYSFENALVPGLLQSEEYARVVIGAYVPPLDETEIDDDVTRRIDRQALLTRKPAPMLGFIVEEWVLRRPIGSKAIMRAQLEHILQCAALRHVSFQIMPMDRASHGGLDGPFVVLETADGEHVAYVEGQAGGVPVADPAEVRSLHQRYAIIRSQALSTDQSEALIKHLIGEL